MLGRRFGCGRGSFHWRLRAVAAEVVGRGDEAAAEVMLPDTVHHHPGGERIADQRPTAIAMVTPSPAISSPRVMPRTSGCVLNSWSMSCADVVASATANFDLVMAMVSRAVPGALTLIASCLINVLYTVGQRVIGRSVKIQSLKVESPLYASGVRVGDTLLEINGQKVDNPEDLMNVLATSDKRPAKLITYRHELLLAFNVERGKLLDGRTTEERLGIEAWSKGRDWRAS